MQVTPIPRHVGLFVAVVQFFLALCWTVYVVYLPQLAAQVGIPKSAVIWLLMLDQLVFLVADYACGVASDRMARLNGRIGPAVLTATMLSCGAFLLLPLVAPGGSAALFVGLTVVWSLSSSALRAPPMNLIGRYAAKPSQPTLVALSMLGLGLAAALSPYLGVALRDLDPRWPFLLASVSLAAATLGIVAAERALQAGHAAAATATDAGAAPAIGTTAASRPLPLPWQPCLLAALLAAAAFQLHVFLNSTPMYLRHATAADLQHLAPVFWVGFNLGLWPASIATRRHGGITVMGTAGLLAAGAAGLALTAGSLEMLLVAQGLAGVAWALGADERLRRRAGARPHRPGRALQRRLVIGAGRRHAAAHGGSGCGCGQLAGQRDPRLALSWAPVPACGPGPVCCCCGCGHATADGRGWPPSPADIGAIRTCSPRPGVPACSRSMRRPRPCSAATRCTIDRPRPLPTSS